MNTTKLCDLSKLVIPDGKELVNKVDIFSAEKNNFGKMAEKIWSATKTTGTSTSITFVPAPYPVDSFVVSRY